MLSKLKVGAKIGGGFGIVLLLTVVVAVVAYLNIQTINKYNSEATGLRVDEVKLAYELAQSMDRHIASARGYLLYGQESLLDQYRQETKTFREKSDKLSDMLTSRKGKELIKDISEGEAEYSRLLENEVLPAYRAGRTERVKQLALGPMAAAGRQTTEGCREMLDTVDGLMGAAVNHANGAGATAVRVVTVLTFLALGLGIALSITITRAVVRPITALVSDARKVAEGDVTVEVRSSGQDEVGDLSRAMSEMVTNIRAAAEAADEIAAGDLAVEIKARSEKDLLSKSMIKVVETLRGVVAETNMLSQAAIEGRLDTRGNAGKFLGGYKDIIDGVNSTLNSLVGHLDLVPSPAMIIDKDFNVQYINQMGADVIGLRKEQLVGTKCYEHFKTSDCRTDNCACAKAMQLGRQATSETDAHPGGHDLDISYTGAPIRDSQGNVIGVLELVTDLTAVKQAARLADKVARFQDVEVRKLTESLDKLSKGDVDFLLQVEDGDTDTAGVRQSFTQISDAVNLCVSIMNGLLDQVGALLKAADEGDLRLRAEAEGFTGGWSELVTGINRLVDSFESAVASVTESAEKVAASSQAVSSTTSEVGKGTQQIAETVGQVALGSQEQSKIVQSSAESMEQLSRVVQEVAAGAQNQAKTVDDAVLLVQQISSAIEDVARLSQESAANGQQVSEVADTGGKQVADAVDGMGRIKDATDRVADMVKQLGESSQQIGAIVETIDDIAEQTNLLALNAAIEAARAGEHGKGFAVVADEVRKLAERSSKATGEIAELISSIQQMTNHAVEAMNKGSQEVAEGTELANEAGVALKQIQSAVSGIVRQIEQMSAATQQVSNSSSEVLSAVENVSAITQQTTAAAEEMSASSGEVTRQMEQVAAVSQENAAASEEVSATTQEQNASVEELSSSAEELASMAQDMQEMVARFKLSERFTGGSVQDVTSTVTSKQRRKAA